MESIIAIILTSLLALAHSEESQMTELSQLRGKSLRHAGNDKSRLLVTLQGCRLVDRCNGIIINSWTLATAGICVPDDYTYPTVKVYLDTVYSNFYCNITRTIHRGGVAIAKFERRIPIERYGFLSIYTSSIARPAAGEYFVTASMRMAQVDLKVVKIKWELAHMEIECVLSGDDYDERIGDPLLSLESVVGIVISVKTATEPTRFASFVDVFTIDEIFQPTY